MKNQIENQNKIMETSTTVRKLSRNEKIAVAVSGTVIGLYLIIPIVLNPNTSYQTPFRENMSSDSYEAGSFVVRDLQVGAGKIAKPGSMVAVDYKGTLPNGMVFDSSYRGSPLVFVLGSGEVITGFNDGILGMKVGGSRIIIMPPELGYGEREVGIIPPGSTLLFEVTLVEVMEESKNQ